MSSAWGLCGTSPATKGGLNTRSGLVRVVGLEPTLLSEPDFESGASTNSTTPAIKGGI